VSKVTPQNLIDMQFSPEQFNAVMDFTAFLQAIIDNQELLLSGRMGSTVFNSATTAIAEQVKRASLCLSAAELLQLRINRLSGNVDADSAVIIRVLQDARKQYLNEAEDKTSRLVSSGAAADSGNYAGGVLATSMNDEGLIPLWPVNGVTV
jgi:hypothetical protein